MTNRPIKKLGEIYPEIKIGGTPSRDRKEYFGGGFPWVSIRDMGDNKYITETKETLSELGVKNSNVKLIKKGALLFSFKLTVGRMAFAGYDLYTNEAIASFEPNENIDLNYLYYILPYVAHQVDRTNNYGAPLLNKSVIANLKIPLPPLSTQQFIVAKLDETFAQIDGAMATTQANIDQTDELTKSVLDKVFEEGEWEMKKMADKDIITLIMGQSPSSETYNKEGVGLPFFQGKKEFGEISPIVEQYCSEPVKIAEAGDILMSVRAPVGPTNLADQKCCIGRGLGAIRPNKDRLLTNYLLYFLKKFEKNITALGKGSTFSAITKADLENVEIPLPPLAKQQEIVSYLDHVFAQSSQLKEQYQKKLVELKELKASVLQSAFEGKLV